jgi:hypothetical protein
MLMDVLRTGCGCVHCHTSSMLMYITRSHRIHLKKQVVVG